MSTVTLGLDLGPTSVGWALIDDIEQTVIAAGVRVFPEGVDRDQQGGEKPKMATRRTARGMRRQIARRRLRKGRLRACLTSAGLLPNDPAQLNALLDENPYSLRRRALDEKLHPHQIGRVFLHFASRRGFLSNRKTDRTKEAKGMLAEIEGLAAHMAETGARTLGEYLARIGEGFDHRSSPEADRLRGRHTQRQMYRDEFEQIWNAQRPRHPDLLTDELKRTLDDPTAHEDWIHQGLLFGQRKMYWPKSMIGRCELVRGDKRCPKAHRAAQRFRLLQEVNNLRWVDTQTGELCSITDDTERRATLIDYLSAGRERTFDQIRKKLELPESVTFNYERAERTKLKGHETDAKLAAKAALGKVWNTIPDDRRDRIVDILIHEDQEAVALKHLMDEGGLTAEQAERAMAINLPAGYMSYGITAIRKLLPYMEQGMQVMADDETNSALHAAGFLRPDQREVNQKQTLPPAPDLPNPLVRQALIEVRKVVNAIIREYGLPETIRIELAREAKLSTQARQEMTFENARRRKLREAIAAQIEKLGFEPKRRNIQKWLLWQEQQEMCPYSGRSISPQQLLSDAVSIDHILPRWRSLDDSMMNKVVCFRDENELKRDQTPAEWLDGREAAKWERVLQFIKRLPFGKQRRFLASEIRLDEFVERQLRDTAYISRCVSQYLRCLSARVAVTRGGMTADLRHYWGLNNILDASGDGAKNRADHRHHAVDAAVIAMTNDQRLQALANARGERVKPPWDGFRDQLAALVTDMKVSYRVQRRVTGALHEQTIYGATYRKSAKAERDRPWAKNWVEARDCFVMRKRVEELTPAMIEDIRDPSIRRLILTRLQQFGIDPSECSKIPSQVWKELLRMPSGVPVKSVRVLKRDQTIRPLRDGGAFVKPGNIHHLCVFEVDDKKGRTAKSVVFVDLFEAMDRIRKKLPIISRQHPNLPDARFLFSLSQNELLYIEHKGEESLYRFETAASTSGQMWFRHHTFAGPSGDKSMRISKKPGTLKARKVTVDVLGRVRWAND